MSNYQDYQVVELNIEIHWTCFMRRFASEFQDVTQQSQLSHVVPVTAGNWSAFDFAIEMQAPDALFRELIRCGADKYARLSSIPSIPSISDKIAVEVDSVDEEIVSVQF